MLATVTPRGGARTQTGVCEVPRLFVLPLSDEGRGERQGLGPRGRDGVAPRGGMRVCSVDPRHQVLGGHWAGTVPGKGFTGLRLIRTPFPKSRDTWAQIRMQPKLCCVTWGQSLPLSGLRAVLPLFLSFDRVGN